MIVVGAALQSTLLQHISIAHQRIDLVLLLVVVFAIQRGPWSGLIWGLLGGLLLDLLSILPFGVHSIVLPLIGLFVGFALRRLSRDYPILPFIATPIITIVFYLLVGAAVTIAGTQLDWPWVIGGVLPPAVLLNTIALPFVYLPVYTISKRTRMEINWQTGKS
jgi:rod shape-determining protein MreD